jgi:hypothetical protein
MSNPTLRITAVLVALPSPPQGLDQFGARSRRTFQTPKLEA